MAIYVEINNERYPASITGRLHDDSWNDRASKAITVDMTYVEAIDLFIDNIKWNIVQDHEIKVEKINEETGEITYETEIVSEIYDNSEYSIAGDIIDHRNGKVTIKMGKPTAEEILDMIVEELSL